MQFLGDDAAKAGRAVQWSEAGFLAALTAGGDSRLAVDPATGTNKYLCPPVPNDALAHLSSCTASPISQAGFVLAMQCYGDIAKVRAGRGAAERRRAWQAQVEARLSGYLGTGALADIVLLPSGTAGVLLTALLLSLEAGRRPMTAILPSASETDTGAPHAAACDAFDMPARCGALASIAEVALRRPDGMPRGDDELCEAFGAATSAAADRSVIYLTHGSKTGLVAPLRVPRGAEVVVDACQLRLAPAVIQGYLRQGWPVVVTGSKFLGGPPFSGAVLLPHGRFRNLRNTAFAMWRQTVAAPQEAAEFALGPPLRWVAATAELPEAPDAGTLSAAIACRMATAERTLAALPGVWVLAGPSAAMTEASGLPASIPSFAVQDPHRPSSWLPADQLRRIYRRLAGHGVLIGQPVDVGPFGALRVAVGLLSVAESAWELSLSRLRDELFMLAANEV